MEQELNNLPKLNKIERWLSQFASSKHKLVVLFIVSFLEQSISPILPDVLIIPISLYKKYSAIYIAAFASVASTFGAMLTYLISKLYSESILNFFSLNSFLEVFNTVYAKNLLLNTFIASLTPIPDKIFTVIGGTVSANFYILMLGIFAGKFLRYYIIAYIAENYGAQGINSIKKYRHYFTLAIVLVIIIYIISIAL